MVKGSAPIFLGKCHWEQEQSLRDLWANNKTGNVSSESQKERKETVKLKKYLKNG